MFKYYLVPENRKIRNSKSSFDSEEEERLDAEGSEPKDTITLTRKVKNRLTRQNKIIKIFKDNPEKQKKFFGRVALNRLDLISQVEEMFKKNEDGKIQLKKKIEKNRSDYILFCSKGVFNCGDVMLLNISGSIYAEIKTDKEIFKFREEEYEIYQRSNKHIAYYVDIYPEETEDSFKFGNELKSKLIFLTSEKLLHLCLELENYEMLVVQKNVSQDLSCLSKNQKSFPLNYSSLTIF